MLIHKTIHNHLIENSVNLTVIGWSLVVFKVYESLLKVRDTVNLLKMLTVLERQYRKMIITYFFCTISTAGALALLSSTISAPSNPPLGLKPNPSFGLQHGKGFLDVAVATKVIHIAITN